MNPQLDLFRDPAPEALARLEGDCASLPALSAMGKRLPAGLRLGAASWTPAVHEGAVDPRLPADRASPGTGLEAYATHPLVRTVGIDRTFYAPIAEGAFRDLAQRVPEEFRFVVKAPQSLTTAYLFETRERSAHFLDPRAAIDLFVAPCLAGLGAAAGPLVFHFPPQGRAATSEPSRFAARLARFLSALPRGPLYAVELRDRALLRPETMRALAETGTRLCLTVHARMPTVAVQAAAATSLGAGPLVVRWNLHAGAGTEEAQDSAAPRDRLVEEDATTRASIATLARQQAAQGEACWVVVQAGAHEPAMLALERLARAILPEAA